MKLVAGFAAALTLLVFAPASAKDYAPRNECRHIPGYEAFEMQLATAVANRDVEMLVALADEDIHLDFGGGSGREEFRRRLIYPDTNYWTEFERLLLLGCANRDGEGVTIPWYFGQDFGGIDYFGSYLVTGKRVPVYSEIEGGNVVRYLNWEPVGLATFYEPGHDDEAPRAQVILGDGERVYVDRAKLRSLVDYRILAGPRDDGKWRIGVFIAGD